MNPLWMPLRAPSPYCKGPHVGFEYKIDAGDVPLAPNQTLSNLLLKSNSQPKGKERNAARRPCVAVIVSK